MKQSKVAILKTSPTTVLRDYHRVMNLAGYQEVLSKDYDTARPRSFAAAGDFTAARNRLPVAVRTRMENNRSDYEFDDSQVFHRHQTAYDYFSTLKAAQRWEEHSFLKLVLGTSAASPLFNSFFSSFHMLPTAIPFMIS